MDYAIDLGNYFVPSDFSLFPGSTLPPELPLDYSYNVPDYAGSTMQPAIQDIPRSDGISLSGVLNQVTSGAQSLLNIWGTANQISSSIENQKYQNQLSAAKLDLQSAQTLGTIDLQKAQTVAAKTIGIAQVNKTVADEMAKVASGGGATLKNGISLTTVAIIVGLFMLMTKQGKTA